MYVNTTIEERQKVFKKPLPETTALEIFRNENMSYNLQFIESSSSVMERDIENSIVSHIDLFLQELGDGFCFCGRQVPIKMDGKTHAVDLVLFHKAIPCTVLIDLKSGSIDSRDIGQMNKYVSYWRSNCQYDYEQPAIGLILGKEAGTEEIAYALEGLEQRIFVATYQTKLPSEDKLKQAVKSFCDMTREWNTGAFTGTRVKTKMIRIEKWVYSAQRYVLRHREAPQSLNRIRHTLISPVY